MSLRSKAQSGVSIISEQALDPKDVAERYNKIEELMGGRMPGTFACS